MPSEQSILFVDNLHAQTTDEFNRTLAEDYNTLVGLLPPDGADDVQAVDAGYGRHLKRGGLEGI